MGKYVSIHHSSPLYVVTFPITMSIPVLLHSYLIQSSAEKFHKNIEGPHYERSKENDMYPSFVIVHYAGRVCTGFTTFNKLRLLFSLLLLFNCIHSPCSQGYMYLGFYLTWRVWCYGNGNTVPSEGRVQPRPQAPLLLRRQESAGHHG